jgi:hypothetical protein
MDNPWDEKDGAATETTGGAVGAEVDQTAAGAVGQDRQERPRLAPRYSEARQRAAEAGLTPDGLRYWLHYDDQTGHFHWLRLGRNHKIGVKAGTLRPDGYISIGVRKSHFLAHRLAWFYVHGVWPPELIDHVNGVRSDNRIANLRLADRRLNVENKRRESCNSTGLLGVKPNGNGFSARIGSRGVEHHLGTFRTPEEAHAAYVEAKRRLHKGCTL